MKRFQFRLARVLALRRQQLELSEARLRAQDEAAREARNAAAVLRRRSLASYLRPRAGARVEAGRIAAADAYAESLAGDSRQQDKEAEHLEARKRTMLKDHLQLRRDLAALETLYARERRRHEQEQERGAEALAAELHLAGRARSRRRDRARDRVLG